jgi:hypothetical protein
MVEVITEVSKLDFGILHFAARELAVLKLLGPQLILGGKLK